MSATMKKWGGFLLNVSRPKTKTVKRKPNKHRGGSKRRRPSSRRHK
jgi:hypothetical protein